jgi:ABC-2 type transport system permease protein
MILIEFVYMLVVDMCFMVALVLLMLPLGIWRQAAFAVMKRNFVGYFSNPTGYVFLCLFVLLTSFAAFWPHEFFTTNLANFDQLNKFLPYVMLVFIPAITMSLWAEERRQGTDELLLTLPAKDFDIVIGKYFAAVLVFTVSLLFSQLSNYAVLLAMTGGQLDNLLLFSTYLGYWFVGIAMISLGMVASFLTNNLTVGFIIGAALNAPLAFFSNADVIFSSSKWIQRLFDWSMLHRFDPFGRGLISASSICYFLGIVVIGIYLSLILIGRRHWLGGRDGTSMFWHYILRAAFLAITVIGGVLIVQHSPLNRARIDISDSQVSTLAEPTIALLERLSNDDDDSKPPIMIEAYVGSKVPTEYVKTKYDLVNLLREFDVLGGKRVQVTLHQGVEPFSEEAILAEQRFGIRPRKVSTQSRGAVREEDVILGLAVSSGPERIVIPFMPYGMPVEYELMRSINTVSKSERKTIGVVQTDALIGGATLQSQGKTQSIPRMMIVSELEKQYNVEPVNAAAEISLWIDDEDGSEQAKRRYDVLLVVQPSKMTPIELTNLIGAIYDGQPVLIFEDPYPNRDNFTHVVGSFLPRQFARSGTGTCDIQKLWDALDIDIDRQKMDIGNGRELLIPWLVWQRESENPYKRDNVLKMPERVVIRELNTTGGALFSGDSPIVNGISEVYFQFAGYFTLKPSTKLEYEQLVKTGAAGRILWSDWMRGMTSRDNDLLERSRGSANQSYTIAAHITGANVDPELLEVKKLPRDQANVNVVYVADMDILADYFVQIRNEPIQNNIEYLFQNMSFVLNAIDHLAGESTYLGLRTRRVRHVTLEEIEKTYEESLQEVYEVNTQYEIDFETAINEARSSVEEKVRPLKASIDELERLKDANKPYDAAKLAAKRVLLQTEEREQEAKFNARQQELDIERQEKKRATNLRAELKIQEIQRKFKLAAVLIPPIPPLLVGLVVFTRRRLREREGISKARRLK